MRKMVIRNSKKKGMINSMLNDDLLGFILEKIEFFKDRESFSEVCKQWLRVERLTRTSFRAPRTIPRRGLTEFPNLINLRTDELITPRKRRNKRAWRYPQGDTRLEVIAKTCQQLETFMIRCRHYDGDYAHLGPKGLKALGTGCLKLSTVMFQGHKVVGNPGLDALLLSAHNLKSLYLVECKLISDPALRAIGSSSISTLELAYCHNVTDEGLGFLANGSTSKTLKRLVLNCCSKITDVGFELLRNMCSLEHLALSCVVKSQFTDVGGMAISAIQTLKELTLHKLDVSDYTMVANLETLDLQYCRKLTGAGIRAFSGHKYLKRLKLIGLTNLDGSDVELVALGCPSLQSAVVYHHELGILN